MPSRNRAAEEKRAAWQRITRLAAEQERQTHLRSPETIWHKYERHLKGCPAVGEQHCYEGVCCWCGRSPGDSGY